MPTPRKKKKSRPCAWEKPLPPLAVEALELPEAAPLLRIAVYGDNQRGIPVHRRIVEAIGLSGAEVVLHVGDYVQDGRRDSQWEEQFAACARPLLDSTVFLGVQGNHDRDSGCYYELLQPPGGRSWFFAEFGPVAFFGLDTNRSLDGTSEQMAWLEDALRGSNSPWKLAFFHEPPYSSSWPWPGGAPKTRRVLVPLCEKYGVSAVFSGHIHNYERSHRAGIAYLITGGGGDTLSKPEQLPNPYREWSAMLHHFCTADVYSDRIRILARDLAGVPFDGVEIGPNGLAEVELETRRGYRGPRPHRYPALGRRSKKGFDGEASFDWRSL